MPRSIKIKGIVFKVGNSYGIRVRKALIDSELITEGQEIELELNLDDNFLNKEPQLVKQRADNLTLYNATPDHDQFLAQIGISAWTLKQPWTQELLH